jgi:hypothetical protein
LSRPARGSAPGTPSRPVAPSLRQLQNSNSMFVLKAQVRIGNASRRKLSTTYSFNFKKHIFMIGLSSAESRCFVNFFYSSCFDKSSDLSSQLEGSGLLQLDMLLDNFILLNSNYLWCDCCYQQKPISVLVSSGCRNFDVPVIQS